MADKPTTVTVRAHGPLVIEGEFSVVRADGTEMALPNARRVKLCRCGHSNTAPLCDGSHNRLTADEFVPGERND